MSKTANPETKNQKGVKNRIQIEIPGQQILQYRLVNKRHRICARLPGIKHVHIPSNLAPESLIKPNM